MGTLYKHPQNREQSLIPSNPAASRLVESINRVMLAIQRAELAEKTAKQRVAALKVELEQYRAACAANGFSLEATGQTGIVRVSPRSLPEQLARDDHVVTFDQNTPPTDAANDNRNEG